MSNSHGRNAVPREFAAMLCLYRNNVAEEVREALQSAFVDQMCPPSLLIVVFDGPVPATVEAEISAFEKLYPVLRVSFPECRGHGLARAAAIDACLYDWIAIIDADDVSELDRFDLLLHMIDEHPNAAVVGGAMTEFETRNGQRVLAAPTVYPGNPESVRRYMRNRSPVAQATSMLRTAAVRQVGNYQPWFNNEDYHLWIRLVAAGYEIWNEEKSVLLVRTSPGQFMRRGGLKYWWSEVRLQMFSYRNGTTTLSRLAAGAALRFVVQVVFPGSLRQLFYRWILRAS